MTKGLRAFANSSLRTMLSKAAAAPLFGAFWGALTTLLVRSNNQPASYAASTQFAPEPA